MSARSNVLVQTTQYNPQLQNITKNVSYYVLGDLKSEFLLMTLPDFYEAFGRKISGVTTRYTYRDIYIPARQGAEVSRGATQKAYIPDRVYSR